MVQEFEIEAVDTVELSLETFVGMTDALRCIYNGVKGLPVNDAELDNAFSTAQRVLYPVDDENQLKLFEDVKN